MSWLQRFLPKRFTQEFVPTEEQLEQRRALASAIRMWMTREHELYDPHVVIEIASSEWQRAWSGSRETHGDKLFNDSYHHLQHFFSDGDIRDMNPEYGESQRNVLKNCIKKLEGNQD